MKLYSAHFKRNGSRLSGLMSDLEDLYLVVVRRCKGKHTSRWVLFLI